MITRRIELAQPCEAGSAVPPGETPPTFEAERPPEAPEG